MACSHLKVPSSHGPEEEGVARLEGTDSSLVHALHGPPLPGGHREGPPGPRQVHGMDRPRWLLPLEAGPAGIDPSHPSTPG